MSFDEDRRHEPDPEVIADLVLRSATEHDSTRAGKPMRPFAKACVVEQWPCRAGCGALVDVTEDAVDLMVMFSAQLASKGEKPLDATKTVFCEKCRAEGQKAACERNRRMVDAIGEAIRDVKEAKLTSDKELETLAKLRKVHPDFEGFLRAVRERQAAESSKRPRRAM